MPFTIHLSIVVFLPLAAGLIAALPAGARRALAGGGGQRRGARVRDRDARGLRPGRAGGLRYVTDTTWISELGIRYQLGVDGLNLFLIALTALLWVPCMLWAALRTEERSKLFMFHMALGETAVLGAFCAQDLALFVVFFDLMLVPFYFLIGGWGAGDRVRATTRFVIYTLVGSLLMLAGAVALGVIAADGGELSFSFAVLERADRGRGHAEVDLPPVRGGLPGEGAAVPAARLGGGHLPRHAHAGARGALGRAFEGGRLRLPADRAADPSRRQRVLPGADAGAGGVLDPLRLGARLLPERAAAGGGVLLHRPAGLHRARHLLPGREGRPGRADADGEPRPGGCAAVLHHRRAHGPRRAGPSRWSGWAAWRCAPPCSPPSS